MLATPSSPCSPLILICNAMTSTLQHLRSPFATLWGLELVFWIWSSVHWQGWSGGGTEERHGMATNMKDAHMHWYTCMNMYLCTYVLMYLLKFVPTPIPLSGWETIPTLIRLGGVLFRPENYPHTQSIWYLPGFQWCFPKWCQVP